MKRLIFILALLFFISCNSSKKEFRVVDLRCEYLVNPDGLDVEHPRLFWKMDKAVAGAKQTAWQVQVASSEELLQSGSADLWDSGVVQSDQSIQIEYEGKPLQSGQNVFWRVKIWDEAGVESAWSETASWKMALLKTSDWQAKWIGAPKSITSGEMKYASPFFRKEIDVSGKVKSARVYISGLGYYELYLNGKKSGDHVLSPNQTNYDRRKREKWSESRIGNMNTRVLYETHDITSLLQDGKNVIGVVLGNGWYQQADRPDEPAYLYDSPRLLAQIQIEYEDGRNETITSDASWKVSTGPILYNGLHSGEIYDARLEQKSWNEAGFDDSKWIQAELVREPTGTLKAQVSPSDRIVKTIRPVKVSQPEKGIYRFDMGQMMSGWARLKVSGEKGTKLKLVFTEEFGPTYRQTDTYILKGEGEEIWEPRFTWHAFRYVDVIGSSVELTADKLEGRVVNTDIQPAGTFECSNMLFNQLLSNYRWTQLGNVHGGVPSDCPHRERRGYTGDGQISSRSAIYNFDMAQFYTKWLGDISDAQNHETGYVPNTTPYDDGGGGTPWGAAYVIIPWYMYQYYGDLQLLQQHYKGMKHWIDFVKNNLNTDGILANQGLGEWVPPAVVTIDPDYVNSCFYLLCCNLMAQISGALGEKNDQAYFSQLEKDAAFSINRVYFNRDKAEYSVGWQGANAYPLAYHFAAKENEQAIFDRLVQSLKDAKMHFDTGILGTPLLLQVLTEQGRIDLAYTLMNQRDFPSFGYMVERGATTIWETFQGDVSHSHPMFGSVCEWFYRNLGGIIPDAVSPAFKHAIIKPYPVSGIDYARTTYPSLYGTIKTDWKIEGADYELNVTIPANTTATVYVLATIPEKVSEGDQDVSQNKHIRFIGQEGHFAVYEVESGEYHFVSEGARILLRKTTLAAPVIKPANAIAQESDTVVVSINAEVKEAIIHYTTDGTDPDSSSIAYEKPLRIIEPTVVKARSYSRNYSASYIQTGVVEFIDQQSNGLKYDYYSGKWMRLPDFSKLKVEKRGTVYEISLDKIIPTHDEFALSFHGSIKIEKEGEYEFFIQSNDGSRLYIDDRLVIDHDGPHGAEIEKTGKVHLTKGLHPIRINYFQAGGGMFLRLQYTGPGVEKKIIPPTVLLQN